MSFFKPNLKEVEDESSGILYILYIKIGEEDVVKIGVTKRKIEERVVEILSSFFLSYRYFPWCYPKRFKKTTNVYAKESMMHQYYKEYSYKTEKRFGGSTEFFIGIEEEELLRTYDKVINGEDINVLEA